MKKKFALLALLVVAVMTLNFAGIAAAASSPLQEEPDYSIGQIKEAGVSYTVQGLVVAKNSRAVVITDGQNSVMIYGSGILQIADLEDFIEITATSSKYNGLLQLSYNSESIVKKLETTPPKEKAAEKLDENIVNDWKAKAEADTLSVSDVQRYSWTATATRLGSYWTLTPSFVTDYQIEPLYVNGAQFTLEEGTNYDVVGYFIGASTTSSTPYAGIMIQELKPVAGQVEVIVESGEYVSYPFETGGTVDLEVTISNSEDQSYTVSSSDTAVAAWEDGALLMKGVGTATITITAKAAPEKTATVTLVLYEKQVKINEITSQGTYLVLGTVVAKTTNAAIVADDTGAIMVYDIKQVSELAINDEVFVSGTVSQYNGLWQFYYNPGVVVMPGEDSPYVAQEPVKLDAAMLEGWQTSRSQADVKLYSWTAVAGLRNGFNVYSLTYGGIAVESEVDLADIVLGSTYDLEGYFVGYNTNNDYASFIITKYTLAQDQQPYLGFNRDTINLGIGSTYTLSPFVGGGITAESVAYVVGDSTVVNLNEETKVITGLKTGTTTITATAGSITRVLTVHVSSAISQVTTSGQFYTVVGRVVAKTTQSMVVHDGKDGILVYGRNVIAGFEVNDIVQVSGTVSTYNNMLQFSNPSVIEATETVPELAPTPLTKDIADGWAAARTTPFPVSACQGYTWEATVEEDEKGFLLIDFNDSSTVIEPAYLASDITLEVGKTYTITGYFIGYSTNNSYAAIAVASAKPVTEE